MKLSSSILLRFAVGILCFIVSVLLGGWTGHLFLEANHWVTHTYEVLDLFSELKANILRVESNSRGYAITGKSWYLNGISSREESVQKCLQSLRSLTVDNSRQQLQLQELTPLVDEKLSNLHQDVELRRNNQSALIAPWIGRPRRFLLTEHIFGILGSMEGEERRLLASRQAASIEVSKRELWISAASSFIAMALIVSSYLSLRRTINAKQETARQLEARTRELEKAQRLAHVGSWHWNIARDFTEWSRELYTIAGLDPNYPAPTYAEQSSLFTPASTAKAQALVESALVNPKPYTYELEMIRSDGIHRWVTGEAEPDFDSTGVLIGLSGTLQDVTEQRSLNEQLKKLASDLEEAQRLAQVGSFTVNLETGQTFLSKEFYRIMGREPESRPLTIEQTESMFSPDTWRQIQAGFSMATDESTPLKMEHEVLLPDGRKRWIVSRAEAIWNEAGKIIGYRGTHHDVTDRHYLDDELRRKNFALEESQRLANVGNWSVSLLTGKAEWSRQMYVIYDWPLHLPPPTPSGGSNFFTPETFARLNAYFEDGIRRGGPMQVEHEVMRADGTRRWVVSHCETQRDESGKPVELRGSTVDLTERKIAEEAMHEAKERAEAGSRSKAEFLASMSHEIRTPMNGVIGMTSLLMTTPLSQEQERYVNAIRTSGESLLTLIEDILDFSKIEAGKIRLEKLPFDIHQVAEDAVELVSAIAADKHLKLLYDPGIEILSSYEGDPHRVRQIILNLLSNAIKFTSEGTVTLAISQGNDLVHGKHVLLKVTDTGIGISENQLASLFQEFTQADSSTTRRFGGTGLGLAISQRLANLMGAEISAESTLGAGSTFWFRLPLQDKGSNVSLPALSNANQRVLVISSDRIDVSYAERVCQSLGLAISDSDGSTLDIALIDCDPGIEKGFQLAQELRKSVRGENSKLIFWGTARDEKIVHRVQQFSNACHLPKPLLGKNLARALSALNQAGAATKPKERGLPRLSGHILVAEDNKTNQVVVCTMLRSIGCTSEVVQDGLEVVEAAQVRRYDLILMDCQMPNMDGWQATEIIRKNDDLARVPIIALTASAFGDDLARCMAAGMNDYLSKPVNLIRLHETLSRWLNADTGIHSQRASPVRVLS